MQTVPAARCQHIRTSGTQCGSPALRNQKFCYYHQENRPQAMEFYLDEESYQDGRLVMPVFEGAHSIQTVIRQVMQLILEKRISDKAAGLLLYALQIASSNLKRMSEENAQPAQVVVDLDKVAETPLELASPSGNASKSQNQKTRLRKKDGEPSEEEIQRQLDYMLMLGQHLDDLPGTDPELERLRKLAEGEADDESDDGLPPGTIQACASTRRSERRHVN